VSPCFRCDADGGFHVQINHGKPGVKDYNLCQTCLIKALDEEDVCTMFAGDPEYMEMLCSRGIGIRI
jgi:hypothetical protein